MPRTVLFVAALTLASAFPLHAQRRFRLGPAVSSISLEDTSGAGHSFTGYGGAVALITGDDGESGLSVARYGDLGTDSRVRRLTLYALDSAHGSVSRWHARPGGELSRPGVRAAQGPQSLRGHPLPARHQEAIEQRGARDRLRAHEGHRQLHRPGLPARRHPLRAGLRGRSTAALGTGLRRGRLPARRLLHPGPGPRHRSGAARRAGVRPREWADDLERQRPPAVAAAQVGRERVRGAGGGEPELEGAEVRGGRGR